MRRVWLAEIRKQQGKTQQEVADSAGISQAAYACIESGMKTPTVQTAKRIAAVLGFEWTRFFEDDPADSA